jgi:hypothetical protein
LWLGLPFWFFEIFFCFVFFTSVRTRGFSFIKLKEDIKKKRKKKDFSNRRPMSEDDDDEPVVVHAEEKTAVDNEGSWALPSVSFQIQTWTDALAQAGKTSDQFCNALLKQNAGEVTQVPQRKGFLETKEERLIMSGTTPMFADIVFANTNDKLGPMIGIINKVRSIAGNALYEVMFAEPVSIATKEAVFLQKFALDLAPECTNTKSADVIATFVARDKNGVEYRKRIDEGVSKSGLHIDYTSASDMASALSFALLDVLVALPSCPGEMVDGRCQEILESAVLKVGQMSDFKTYLGNTTQFQMDFEQAVQNKSSWVQEFSAFFIVDKPSYEELHAREKALRRRLLLNKDQCTAQFLLSMHRSVFESYLMQLNNLWQKSNITHTEIAAIMWLLYFTQLPVFVLKLLEMMVPQTASRKNITARIHPLVKTFHTELLTHVSGFLPVRNPLQKEQSSIIDCVRKYLEQIRIGVQEQMSMVVTRQTPECLGL